MVSYKSNYKNLLKFLKIFLDVHSKGDKLTISGQGLSCPECRQRQLDQIHAALITTHELKVM
jgi:hypothetical protein